MSKAVYFAVNSTRFVGPELCIRILRVRPQHEGMFGSATIGHSESVLDQLSRGEASVLDIDEHGCSALCYAVISLQGRAAKLLLDAGADPHQKNRQDRTSFDGAWDDILRSTCDSETAEAFRSMFNNTDALERRHFSRVHEIVLGLWLGSLEGHLEVNPDSVSYVDADGRTALSWAAARGDIKAIRTPLEYGAPANLSDYHRKSPLHYVTATQANGQ